MKDPDLLKFARTAAQKVNNQTVIMKMALDRASLEKELEQAFCVLGRYCFKGLEKEGFPDDRCDEYRRNIAMLEEQIGESEVQIEFLKGKK